MQEVVSYMLQATVFWCFLTRGVTGSDLSEGQLRDCEDVIKAELDSEAECDASDS
jgi:hypothetical protein